MFHVKLVIYECEFSLLLGDVTTWKTFSNTLVFVWEIYESVIYSRHKGPVTGTICSGTVRGTMNQTLFLRLMRFVRRNGIIHFGNASCSCPCSSGRQVLNGLGKDKALQDETRNI